MGDHLQYIIDHIFCPPKLPQHDDRDEITEHALLQFVLNSATEYHNRLSEDRKVPWWPLLTMLKNLSICYERGSLITTVIERLLSELKRGDVFSLHIRAQNAGLVIRQLEDRTVFEAFEVSPPPGVVLAAEGKLLCSYPGPAVSVPCDVFVNPKFRKELSSFLTHMDVDVLDSTPVTRKAGSEVREIRDTAHPRYITQLLTGILRGMGHVADVTRIQKRIGDDVLWKNAYKPWRRSCIWLVIRVVLQTSLYRETKAHTEYKAFMIFLMSKALLTAADKQFPSDLVFCMRAKISRRLAKLGILAPKMIIEGTRDACTTVEKLLQWRWSQVQQLQEHPDKDISWDPASLDIIDDTRLSLNNSRPYLIRVMERGQTSAGPAQVFAPRLSRRLRGIQVFREADRNLFQNIFSEHDHIALADFEMAVQNSLDEWFIAISDVPDGMTAACETLSMCIAEYSNSSRKTYAGNPEDWSTMLLTLFELWVALDKLAVAQYPLLAKYSPEVPLGLLDSLLLRRRKSLERLALIEQYLRKRHHQATPNSTIFDDGTSKDSFAVRFFETSPHHQSLKARIEAEAREERKERIAILNKLNAEHQDLSTQLVDADSHQYELDPKDVLRHYPDRCVRCKLETKMKKLTIDIHEWPLPFSGAHANATVFELDVPVVFGIWRATSYMLLHDICSPQHGSGSGTGKSHLELGKYEGLQKYFNDRTSPRISLKSTNKSFVNTHYKSIAIPATETSICVNNGMYYKLFDKENDKWVADSIDCNIAASCTLQLPFSSPYRALQFAVDATSHTSNQVMAMQSDCSRDLSIHEFIAFASLRSGPRLQWLNIARELRARSVSLQREEVHILLTQSALQVGQSSVPTDRDWHTELNNGDFGLVLLDELEDLLASIAANWLEVVTMRTLTVLVTRLIASASDRDVLRRAYNLLRKSRLAACSWMRQLADKLQATKDDILIKEFQLRLVEVAVTCRSTYDVDLEHAEHILSTPGDIETFLEAAIRIRDNTPPDLGTIPTSLKRLLARDRRLSHAREGLLHRCIREQGHGLDQAVKAVWSGYRAGTQWRILPSPNDRWLVTETEENANRQSQSVQINILDGQLLINGKPLGRLPEKIVKHPLYTLVLGQRVLDVVPADVLDMDYVTRSTVSDYQVFFRFRESDQSPLIRIQQNLEAPVLELIPPDTFTGDLPVALVENCVHWMNLSSGKVEFRPTESIWTSSPENWAIHFAVSGSSTMQKRRRQSIFFLMDIRSRTFQMMSSRLSPLEYSENIMVTCTPMQSLTANLDRLRLSFHLTHDGFLESHNWPNMVIDDNQSVGTLLGLASQLVLREKHIITSDRRSRRVIIPHGKVNIMPQNFHTKVLIDTRGEISVKFYEYLIDPELGRLLGNATLESNLYKIYLHAITSHCLPDPLTQSTGIEEALHELRSAGCQSFQSLGRDEMQLLCQISSLTPGHIYYPAHLPHMQTVAWTDVLSWYVQYHEFSAVVESIRCYARHLCVFDQDPEKQTHLVDASLPAPRNTHLVERAARRNRMFYSPGLTTFRLYENADVAYKARDMVLTDEVFAFETSSLVHSWQKGLKTEGHLFELLRSWGSLGNPANHLTMSYSREWLEPDLSDVWIYLYNRLRASSRDDHRYQLAFTLSALTYSSSQHRTLMPTILAFATSPQFALLSPPLINGALKLRDGCQPQHETLTKTVQSCAIRFEDSPEAGSMSAFQGGSKAVRQQRRKEAYETFQLHCNSQAREIVATLMSRWPCKEPVWPLRSSDDRAWLFNMPRLRVEIATLFGSWYQNRQFRRHMEQVQTALDAVSFSDQWMPGGSTYTFTRSSHHPPSPLPDITLDYLMFRRDAPIVDQSPVDIPTIEAMADRAFGTDTSVLASLISEFQNSESDLFYRLYGDSLHRSRQGLDREDNQLFSFLTITPLHLEQLTQYRNQYEKQLHQILSSINRALSPSSPVEETLFIAGQWPRITSRALLGNLTSEIDGRFVVAWRPVTMLLARALIGLQRSHRLLRLAISANGEELLKELQGDATANLFTSQNPNWLLIQIDGDFLARPVQTQVAREMISPSSGQNTALQLNMGEGKSSVIVPMVAAALADGEKLVRVIVLKSLATQMFQLLVERLSGLANRRIFFMPFSRAVRIGLQQAQIIQQLYEECLRVRGVMVIQPEHVLSFKLMGIDRLIHSDSAHSQVADALLQSQKWLQERSRDILDESDEILNVRYQLIYTSGQQRPLDHHPDRWTIVQDILSLVRKHAPHVQLEFPLGIEVQSGEADSGRFPRVRVVHADAGVALLSLLTRDLLEGALPNYPLSLLSGRLRQVALLFLTRMNVPSEDVALLERHCKGTGLWSTILLLRGLLAHGIIIHLLKERRWRVDYGLDYSRSLLAVPYRAMNVPTLRAEFGHPDVAIGLTCLSYYYDGLSDGYLNQCFDLLYKLDNPSVEYEKWIRNNKFVPPPLRHLSAVNIKDAEQCRLHLYPAFYRNSAVVNFFLSQVVFPKQAKTFPKKLSSSGWDLAENKRHLTTGFSGTNDNRYLLPTSIIQDDPVNQLSTNAKVLNFLLQPENDQYLCFQKPGQSPCAKALLVVLESVTPEIRVLLDVGAQMLEMANAELAKQWLTKRGDIPAVVFFGEKDELVVQTRDGTIEALVSSPFRQQLDKCLIYLDDAHTRGTDLKLPRGYRAAVTLGPKVTKDRLLQGCMRMRKLGHGQSVMFLAPLEVDRSIRRAARKKTSDAIHAVDILRWAMQETCANIQHHVPHWAKQGVDYQQRRSAWDSFVSSAGPSVEVLRSSWLQDDARTLEVMYGLLPPGSHLPLQTVVSTIPELASRCQMLGVVSLANVQMEEEQEREVDHEVELEREVERPPKATAATHEVHAHVREFVRTGALPQSSPAFDSLFFPLDKITVGFRDSHAWMPNLLATRDFSRTIQGSLPESADYLRPVHWVLSSNKGSSLFVVLSPFEVNDLLPLIRKSSAVHLHMYAPRVIQSMKSFDDLRFYCIPSEPWWDSPGAELRNQLNLWAGQLYLADRETYLRLCSFLSLYTEEHLSVDNVLIQSDGFIRPEHRRHWSHTSRHRSGPSPFRDSPVPFLRELFGLRRKGLSYDCTHLGRILHAGLLTDEDFKN